MKNKFLYGEEQLTVGKSLKICSGELQGAIGNVAKAKIQKCKKAVDKIIEHQKIVYGINTGFGPLCTTIISKEDTIKLQNNILQSHSVGLGDPVSKDIAKLMMILKIQSLSFGYSGIRMETLQRIQWHIENNVIPVVPSQGSVGASGDLAPLAHLFLPLIGLGHVWEKDKQVQSTKILKKYALEPLELGPKEGLALINGTQFISSFAIKIVEELQNCLDHADIIAAMNLEAMLGSAQPFLPELHELRPYAGNKYVAQRMHKMLEGSEILKSHEHCERVQDQYSLRCIPQVHGASRNAWLHLKELLEIELNSVTDNPVIFDEDHTISGGNFHGQPLALPLDYAGIAAAELGNIADRRIYFSLEGKIEGLPILLMEDTGLNSGFMIPQYTSAALVSENKTLCFPASADSIPTSLGQEDHVSMGSISGRKTLKIIWNLEKILAIELTCAAQGFDFRRPLKSTKILNACHDYVRMKIPTVDKDRVYSEDINIALDIIKNKELVKVVKEITINENIEFKNEDHEVFGIY
ncbi:MAG: histidine ammonia-lyase [Cyclobacteriaceae bacterium]|nr:histidine ammonia-lyase [Cyclobacteriaceae bacterium]